MSKKKKNRVDVVYSTNPDYSYEHDEDQEMDTLSPNEQLLYVSLDKKNRSGKAVSLIEGFVGSKDDLKTLSKSLKQACGVGGNEKDGNILIQGDHRNKVVDLLEKAGYKVKRKGG